jgi:hypothetical protein
MWRRRAGCGGLQDGLNPVTALWRRIPRRRGWPARRASARREATLARGGGAARGHVGYRPPPCARSPREPAPAGRQLRLGYVARVAQAAGVPERGTEHRSNEHRGRFSVPGERNAGRDQSSVVGGTMGRKSAPGFTDEVEKRSQRCPNGGEIHYAFDVRGGPLKGSEGLLGPPKVLKHDLQDTGDLGVGSRFGVGATTSGPRWNALKVVLRVPKKDRQVLLSDWPQTTGAGSVWVRGEHQSLSYSVSSNSRLTARQRCNARSCWMSERAPS